MEMTIQDGQARVAAIMKGSFDTLSAEQLEPQVQELESMASKPLELDCTALDYIASSGLRILLRLRKAYAAKGQQVSLLNVNEQIMEVLKVTHFDNMFQIK